MGFCFYIIISVVLVDGVFFGEFFLDLVFVTGEEGLVVGGVVFVVFV